MPPIEEIVAALGILAMTVYALLAVADFGGGVWDIFATRPRKEEQRRAISNAIGPVWEANHVWLIFFIVILFVAYPRAFSALSIALFLPFHLVLLGIVLRGAAFVFRNYGPTQRWRRVWSGIFGASSIITPVFLGMGIAAVSSGGIRMIDGHVRVDTAAAWINPFAFATGFVTLAIGAYLAAVYLTLETRGNVQEDFRRRSLWSAGVVLLTAALTLPLMARQAPRLWNHLGGGYSELFMLLNAVLTITAFVAIQRREYRLARIFAGGQVTTLFWGWAVAQRPFIIYPDVTVINAAAPEATLHFLLWTLPFGGLLLIPSLWLLFAVFKRTRKGVR